MKLPIIISDDGDAYVYEILADAELDIEPPDVLRGAYKIYDVEGRVLKPIVIPDPSYDVVRIIPTEEFEPLELRKILIDYLEHIGHDRLILESMDTEQLAMTIYRLKKDQKNFAIVFVMDFLRTISKYLPFVTGRG